MPQVQCTRVFSPDALTWPSSSAGLSEDVQGCECGVLAALCVGEIREMSRLDVSALGTPLNTRAVNRDASERAVIPPKTSSRTMLGETCRFVASLHNFLRPNPDAFLQKRRRDLHRPARTYLTLSNPSLQSPSSPSLMR